MQAVTREQVEEYVATFPWFRDPARQAFLATAADRLTHTLNLIPRLPDPGRVRVLELGAQPYFMTVLVRKLLGYDLKLLNEPAFDRGPLGNRVRLVSEGGDVHDLEYTTGNVELDDWPYQDDTFDLVLCCEVVQHLVYDPTHALAEAHRVLKKGTGQLVLSTPNALAWTALVRTLKGENPFPPFSGAGALARNHRLFSPGELAHLLRQVGFEVGRCYSAYDEAYDHPRWLDPLMRWLVRRGRLGHRLDVAYLLATAVGRARHAYPSSPPFVLYQDLHGYERARTATVRMAEETGQLVDGFYPLEPWGGGVRWTAPTASLFLQGDGKRKLSVTFFSGERTGNADVRGWVALGGPEEGARRHEFSVPAASWHTLTFPVPEQAPAKLLVTIGVDNVLVPREYDRRANDTRKLGIAVREISLV